jgi:hypothetical protein
MTTKKELKAEIKRLRRCLARNIQRTAPSETRRVSQVKVTFDGGVIYVEEGKIDVWE